MGNSLYAESPEEFTNFMISEEGGLSAQTAILKPSDMKPFAQFAFNGDGLKLSFKRGGATDWQNNVKATSSGSVVISNAPSELIELLKEE